MAFVRKWSDETRAAVIAAVFEREWSTRITWEAAKSGELPQLKPGELRPVASPDIPLGTIRHWVGEERARRKFVASAAAAPDVVLSEGIGRLAALFNTEVARAERLSAKRKLEPKRIAEIAKAGVEIRRLVQVAAKPNGPRSNGDAPASNGQDAEGSWLAGLAEEPGAG